MKLSVNSILTVENIKNYKSIDSKYNNLNGCEVAL